VHLMGTIFSGGLIHIWCSPEYLGQQISAVVLSQNKLQCVSVVIKHQVSAAVWLTDVFLICFFEQWSSVAQE